MEVIISMVISSIVLMILTQMLSMNMQMRNKIEKDNILFNQSSTVTTTIQKSMFDMEAQEIELSPDSTDRRQVIIITHAYDWVFNDEGVLEQSTVDAVSVELVLDLDNNTLTFNGVELTNDYIVIGEDSSITAVPMDQDICDTDENSPSCEIVLLKIDLFIDYQRDSDEETTVDPRQFVSTIII